MKWTDVKYGLPDNNKSVLCYCQNSSTMGETKTIGSYANGVWFLGDGVIGQEYPRHYWKVTHWMPLPESPIPTLRFCPKCRFVAVYDEYQQDGVRVRCTHCGNKTDFYSNQKEAAEDWNTRTQKEGEQVDR